MLQCDLSALSVSFSAAGGVESLISGLLPCLLEGSFVFISFYLKRESKNSMTIRKFPTVDSSQQGQSLISSHLV